MTSTAIQNLQTSVGPQLATLTEFHLTSENANSKNATYENECQFNVPQVVSPEFQAINVTLKSCTIPVSWYMISVYNNKLVFQSNNVLYTATLTVGNYTALTFATLVAAAIITATTGGAEGAITVAIAYSTVTGKYTYTRSSNPSNFSWGFSTTSTCLRETGFYNATTAAQLRTTGTSLVSPNVVDLTGVNTVFVDTNLNGANYDTQSKAVGGIIARIPVSVQFAGVLDPAPNFPTTAIIDRDIRFFTITLRDQYNNIITATTPWQMTILVSFSWDFTHAYFQNNNYERNVSGTANLAPQTKVPSAMGPPAPRHGPSANATVPAAATFRGGAAAAAADTAKITPAPEEPPPYSSTSRHGDLRTLLSQAIAGKRKRQPHGKTDRAQGDPRYIPDDQLPSSELEPSVEETVAMDTLTQHIQSRMDLTGRDFLEPQTYGPNNYPAPAPPMLEEFDVRAARLAALSRDPLGSTNNQKRILSVLSVGPNTVHQNNVGPGPS